MGDWRTTKRDQDAARRAAAAAHNAAKATTWRRCPWPCPFCLEEEAERKRRAALPDRPPPPVAPDGTASLYDVKEAAGVRHGGFLPRPVTVAPFGGTPEARREAVDEAAEARREHRAGEELVERSTRLKVIDPATAFVCRTEQCIECGDVSVALCDGPSATGEGTCDAPMCPAHRNPAGEDRDLCFICVERAARARRSPTKRKPRPPKGR